MPGGFKSNRADDSYNNNTNQAGSVTGSHTNAAPGATPMRATNVLNPRGSAFEVAGPTSGGTPSPFNSDRLEQAKEHLADRLNGIDHSADHGNTLNVSSSGSGHARRPSLTETVISGASTAASTAATAASSAATGAAAAAASVIAAANKLIHHGEDEHAAVVGHDNHATTVLHDTVSASSAAPLSSNAMNPGDRAPLKVNIHAMKPSDKATYGNLDSPGATVRQGPLSDKALAGTTPVTEVPKTIADPFGPVKVSNWNDGHREHDVSTPTSGDFDGWLDSPRSKHIQKSFTAPGAVVSGPLPPVAHKSSPLKVTKTENTIFPPRS